MATMEQQAFRVAVMVQALLILAWLFGIFKSSDMLYAMALGALSLMLGTLGGIGLLKMRSGRNKLFDLLLLLQSLVSLVILFGVVALGQFGLVIPIVLGLHAVGTFLWSGYAVVTK